MFMALNFRASLNVAPFEQVLISFGRRLEGNADPYGLGTETSPWLSWTSLLASVAFQGTHMPILRLATAPPVACFVVLVVADSLDDRMSLTQLGVSGLLRFKQLVYDALDMRPQPFPRALAGQGSLLTSLRVTIYPRFDAARRRMLNWAELCDHLSTWHSVTVLHVFGTRTPAEQLSAFAHADVFIAPHGAHLTMSFLLPLDAVLIECFPEPRRLAPPWLATMVKANHVRHYELTGGADVSQNFSTLHQGAFDADFRVNASEMYAVLRAYGVAA